MDRFWEKVRRGDGCWEWQAGCTPSGYGVFRLNGRNERAHRMAWKLERGPIPDGLWVLHHCDNRRCVRLEHLYLGTHDDNMRDRRTRGRYATGDAHVARTIPGLHVGTRNGRAVLTPERVRELREMWATGRYRQRDLAPIFGISKSQVANITSGAHWR